jgi:hypothetical protein
MADIKEQQGAVDAHAWKWLSTMVEQLGADGMSSEDSNTETHGSSIEPVCRIRVMNWRRGIEDELQIIDDQRHHEDGIFSPGGSKPVMRIRSPQNEPGGRKPLPGLPCSFYNDNWYKVQTDSYIQRTLRVSREKFKWMNIEAKRTS